MSHHVDERIIGDVALNIFAVKISEELAAITARLDKLETVVAGNDRTFREIISDGAEFADRLDAFELRFPATVRSATATLAALTSRLDKLEHAVELVKAVADGHRVTLYALEPDVNKMVVQMFELAKQDLALVACLGELKRETAEWIDGLQGEDARQAARLDKLETADLHWEDLVDAHLNRLTEQVEHEWRARQLADDAQSAYIGALGDESRALELRVLNQGMQLGDRLGALEQAARDQARNSNASAIAFNDRLDAFELRFPATVRSATAALGALEAELNGLRDIISATLNRLAEIEKPSRVVLTSDGEWVQGNGLLPSDVLDGSRGGGE